MGDACPTCGSEFPDDHGVERGLEWFYGYCPDPFHTPERWCNASQADKGYPEGEAEHGCLICGADHPRGAPHQPGEVTRLRARADAAEARIRELEKVAQNLEDDHWPYEWQIATREKHRAETAEARIRELEQALELIASFVPDEEDLSHGDGGYEAGNVARATLSPEEGE